jgi:hypothetical protein
VQGRWLENRAKHDAFVHEPLDRVQQCFTLRPVPFLCLLPE